jgi:hypothetical protein
MRTVREEQISRVSERATQDRRAPYHGGMGDNSARKRPGTCGKGLSSRTSGRQSEWAGPRGNDAIPEGKRGHGKIHFVYIVYRRRRLKSLCIHCLYTVTIEITLYTLFTKTTDTTQTFTIRCTYIYFSVSLNVDTHKLFPLQL